jgi:hypothetical protein
MLARATVVRSVCLMREEGEFGDRSTAQPVDLDSEQADRAGVEEVGYYPRRFLL